MTKTERLSALGKGSAQLTKKIYNLEHGWRLLKRPDADLKKWRWTDWMNEIFGNDRTIQLLHVADYNDGWAREEILPMLVNSLQKKIDQKAEILGIEKKRIHVLKEVASLKAKNKIFYRLISAIEKIADKLFLAYCIKYFCQK